MTIISTSKYNAHTDHIFKKLQFLKLNDIHKVQQLKFYYKLVNTDLPEYFSHIPYLCNFEIHQHYTRGINNLFIPRVSHEYTKTYIRHNVIETVNDALSIIIYNIYTHNLHGFITYIKNYIIMNYKCHCFIPNCYISNI